LLDKAAKAFDNLKKSERKISQIARKLPKNGKILAKFWQQVGRQSRTGCVGYFHMAGFFSSHPCVNHPVPPNTRDWLFVRRSVRDLAILTPC